MKTLIRFRTLLFALSVAFLSMPVAWADPCGDSNCAAALTSNVEAAAAGTDIAASRDVGIGGSLSSTGGQAFASNFLADGCSSGPGGGAVSPGATNCAVIFQEAPEPGTLTLLGIALIAATLLVRRKRDT
jgi:hypothetical protein